MVSIVIPCYNEKEGIGSLLEAIFEAFESNGIDGEVVIVDDNSPDGTGEEAERLKSKYNLQVLHREGKLGLSSAVIDGFKIAKGDILGVMDADFSHDPKTIPNLVNAIVKDGAELAIGSRYVPGGGIENWPLKRRIISKGAIILGSVFTSVKDITSGFFFLKKEVIEGVALNPIGFKIGLEVIMKGKYNKIVEIPYVFTDRKSGSSKMNMKEVFNYLIQLSDLWKYRRKR